MSGEVMEILYDLKEFFNNFDKFNQLKIKKTKFE